MMLCPDCPLKHLWDEARKNLMKKQFIKGLKEEPGVLKICMEVRRLAAEYGEYCEYFKTSLGPQRITLRSPRRIMRTSIVNYLSNIPKNSGKERV